MYGWSVRTWNPNTSKSAVARLIRVSEAENDRMWVRCSFAALAVANLPGGFVVRPILQGREDGFDEDWRPCLRHSIFEEQFSGSPEVQSQDMPPEGRRLDLVGRSGRGILREALP